MIYLVLKRREEKKKGPNCYSVRGLFQVKTVQKSG